MSTPGILIIVAYFEFIPKIIILDDEKIIVKYYTKKYTYKFEDVSICDDNKYSMSYLKIHNTLAFKLKNKEVYLENYMYKNTYKLKKEMKNRIKNRYHYRGIGFGFLAPIYRK